MCLCFSSCPCRAVPSCHPFDFRYIPGLPLLFGNAVERGSKTAIEAAIPGLQVYGSDGAATCDAAMPTQTVNFAEDLVSGCILSLTHADFVDMCNGQGAWEGVSPETGRITVQGNGNQEGRKVAHPGCPGKCLHTLRADVPSSFQQNLSPSSDPLSLPSLFLTLVFALSRPM